LVEEFEIFSEDVVPNVVIFHIYHLSSFIFD